MSLKEKIVADLKDSLKAGDNFKRDTLRFLFSAVKNAEIEKRKKAEGLSDQEIIETIRKSIKQRKDSVEQYEKGGRKELADKEKKEIELLSAYLPAQLGEEAIREEVKKSISQTGASSQKDFGKVMGIAMKSLKGKADGDAVNKIVKEELEK